MNILKNDKQVLKELGKEVSEIAHLPVNEKRRTAWKQLNGLKRVKPLTCIYEIPWHEMNVGEELTLKTNDALSKQTEWNLRETLYRWKHLPGDMVVEPVIYSPLSITDTGIGITEDVGVAKTDKKNPIVSRHFNIQISHEDDIEKIKMPTVTHNAEITEQNYAALQDIFDGIIPVQIGGIKDPVFNAWDELVRWTGIEEALTDISQRPDCIVWTNTKI
ncbi:MAG: hypothetical protein NTY10_02360 [Candidatus Omnitrophica bacterium]|nr:hypothetical protein [Candidatus Omnitrophota bacterium]